MVRFGREWLGFPNVKFSNYWSCLSSLMGTKDFARMVHCFDVFQSRFLECVICDYKNVWFINHAFSSLLTWRWKSNDANVLLILGDASKFQSVFPTQTLIKMQCNEKTQRCFNFEMWVFFNSICKGPSENYENRNWCKVGNIVSDFRFDINSRREACFCKVVIPYVIWL